MAAITKLELRFVDVDTATAGRLGRLASKFQRDLQPSGVECEIKKPDAESQDFGTVLTVLLKSSAVSAFARVICAAFKRHRPPQTEIVWKNGKLARIKLGDIHGVDAEWIENLIRKQERQSVASKRSSSTNVTRQSKTKKRLPRSEPSAGTLG